MLIIAVKMLRSIARLGVNNYCAVSGTKIFSASYSEKVNYKLKIKNKIDVLIICCCVDIFSHLEIKVMMKSTGLNHQNLNIHFQE